MSNNLLCLFYQLLVQSYFNSLSNKVLDEVQDMRFAGVLANSGLAIV